MSKIQKKKEEMGYATKEELTALAESVEELSIAS